MHFQPFNGVGQRVATPETNRKISLVNLLKNQTNTCPSPFNLSLRSGNSSQAVWNKYLALFCISLSVSHILRLMRRDDICHKSGQKQENCDQRGKTGERSEQWKSPRILGRVGKTGITTGDPHSHSSSHLNVNARWQTVSTVGPYSGKKESCAWWTVAQLYWIKLWQTAVFAGGSCFCNKLKLLSWNYTVLQSLPRSQC